MPKRPAGAAGPRSYPGIQNLRSPERRQRTLEVWQATIRLLQALDAWQDWFGKLSAEGDAHPASALFCYETAVQSIRVLCTYRVNMPPFHRESEAAILAMLPPLPDWSMAGTHGRWDDEQNQFVSYERPRWQDDHRFLARYYDGPEKRADKSMQLRGAAFQLHLLLQRFPMTALDADSATARRLEERFSVHESVTVATASRVESREPNSAALASTAFSTEQEQGVSASAHAAPSANDDRTFIPSELQERILAALVEKALTLDALVEKLDVDRSSLHRHGIKELMSRGLIANKRRVGGYYRIDAPPPKYAEQLRRRPR